MKYRSALTRARKKQSGYALLMVVFLTTLILVASMSIGLRILTEGRRQKEQEMIWRGKQYVRGIKLYYLKLGRFPNSMDDLTKPKIGNLRFMRQAYKDPMNKEDGSWRLIYVGPAGNLIGSLKPQPSGIQLPGAGGQPGAAGTSQGGLGSQPSATGGISAPGTSPGGIASGTGSSATGTGTGAPGTDTAGTGTGTDASATGTDAQAVPTGDTPTIVGGNIIGIGSKINQKSVIVYEKAKNYRLFEFIWDPSKDLGLSGGAGTPIGTPTGTPGQNPTGTQTNPLNPPQIPPTSAPTPNPNPPQQ
jgi:hypothetical protein